MEITEQNLQAQVQAALMTILAPAASANVDIDGVLIRIVNSVGSTFAYVPIATILSGTLSGYLKSDKLQTMTEAEYDALVTKYADTYYFTYEDEGEGGDGDEGDDSGDGGGGSEGDVDVYWGTPENNMVSLTVGDTTYTLCLVGHKHSAADITDLATVASTGSYNDLSDKPNFDPTNYVDTVSDQLIGGHKTFGGSLDIGSTLAFDQAGAISYDTDNDSFTFTAHGADVAVLDSEGLYVDGNINISSDDFSAIVNATDGTLQQALNAKQNILVSGTSIKTINGVSLLGAGDISTLTPMTLVSLYQVNKDTLLITSVWDEPIVWFLLIPRNSGGGMPPELKPWALWDKKHWGRRGKNYGVLNNEGDDVAITPSDLYTRFYGQHQAASITNLRYGNMRRWWAYGVGRFKMLLCCMKQADALTYIQEGGVYNNFSHFNAEGTLTEWTNLVRQVVPVYLHRTTIPGFWKLSL